MKTQEEIDNIVMEIRNFILFFTSDDKEREDMEKSLEVYKIEDLEDRYMKGE